MDWVLRRCDDEPCHEKTPLGFVPAPGALNTGDLGDVNMKELFSIPKDFWMQEVTFYISVEATCKIDILSPIPPSNLVVNDFKGVGRVFVD